MFDRLRLAKEIQVHMWVSYLEAGEMGYEVWKWLDSGDVEFRIHRFVRSANVSNPVVRLGFRLLGRREQIRFAERACERMAELVELERVEPPLESRAG